MTNTYFKEKAREQLKGQYWIAFYIKIITLMPTILFVAIAVFGMTFIESVLADSPFLGLLPPLIGFIFALTHANLLAGRCHYLLSLVRETEGNHELTLLLKGFKENYEAPSHTFLYSKLFVLLWSLLLIVPGIVKMFSYSMAYYIVADNYKIGAPASLTASKEMMDGHKLRLFKLYLSFSGWFLLTIPTLFIGLFFLMPYVDLAVANFYEELKDSNTKKTKYLQELARGLHTISTKKQQ